jgi:hypothetical protein
MKVGKRHRQVPNERQVGDAEHGRYLIQLDGISMRRSTVDAL